MPYNYYFYNLKKIATLYFIKVRTNLLKVSIKFSKESFITIVNFLGKTVPA
jgi:hypothetical protein